MPATPKDCRLYRVRLRIRARRKVALGGKVACAKCGKTRSLELAHVKPTGLSGSSRGMTHRYRDAIDNHDCYTLLCKRCHQQFDSDIQRG